MASEADLQKWAPTLLNATSPRNKSDPLPQSMGQECLTIIYLKIKYILNGIINIFIGIFNIQKLARAYVKMSDVTVKIFKVVDY